MENEINRVLTHPALGLQHWNIETSSRFVKIIKLIFNIQRKIVHHRLTTRIKGEHGDHYKECLWSNPDVRCGPDTCVCSYINMDRHRITLLLDEIASQPQSV